MNRLRVLGIAFLMFGIVTPSFGGELFSPPLLNLFAYRCHVVNVSDISRDVTVEVFDRNGTLIPAVTASATLAPMELVESGPAFQADCKTCTCRITVQGPNRNFRASARAVDDTGGFVSMGWVSGD